MAVLGTESVLILGYGGSRPPVSPPSALPAHGEPGSIADALLSGKQYRPDEILVEVPSDGADALRDALAHQYAVEVRDLGVVTLINSRLLHMKLSRGQNLRTTLARLLQDRRVLKAQPNYIYTPVQGAPQAGRPGAQSGSGLQPGGKGVKVAVIDSCIDRHHPEIEGSVEASYDAVSRKASDCTPEDHGTAVASLIAGHGQIHGPASKSSLLAARAFTLPADGREAEGTSVEIVLSLDWAAEAGAQVVNMSFAGPSDPLLERSVASAYREGIVLVAAAGNAGPSSPPLYPAAYPETVAVTACDARQQPYAAANRGAHIAISARGVDVLIAHPGNSYAVESGTSFAAATVSGVVAVMRESRPKASPDEVKAALVSTAVAMQGSAGDGTSGHGLLDAVAAVAFVRSSASH